MQEWNAALVVCASSSADTICSCARINLLYLLVALQFQLHLPHYSSKDILRARLLTAIQNAGTRSDGGSDVSKLNAAEAEIVIPRSVYSTPTYVLQPTSGSVGHREELSDLCERKCASIDACLH